MEIACRAAGAAVKEIQLYPCLILAGQLGVWNRGKSLQVKALGITPKEAQPLHRIIDQPDPGGEFFGLVCGQLLYRKVPELGRPGTVITDPRQQMPLLRKGNLILNIKAIPLLAGAKSPSGGHLR